MDGGEILIWILNRSKLGFTRPIGVRVTTLSGAGVSLNLPPELLTPGYGMTC